MDHDGAVMPGLLLHSGVAVIPVGTVLFNIEGVGIGRARLNTGKADTWHTVHIRR